jgi:hypothetical protein|tara:strand:+ start:502 stop:885 length:384 start_codon:yes stop_codon:yes gene_type:complete
MLKTNSTKYQLNFKKYILSVIDSEDLPSETMTNKEKVFFIMDRFIKEYCYQQNLDRYDNNMTKLMAEWLSGLAINIPYTYCDIIKLSKELLETDTLKNEDEIIENYFNFMAIQIFKLANRLHDQNPK